MMNFRCDLTPHRLTVEKAKCENSHLDVYSLDDAGDDMEYLHFGVALCHLLQQLEEQPEYRLEVLTKRGELKFKKRRKWTFIKLFYH